MNNDANDLEKPQDENMKFHSSEIDHKTNPDYFAGRVRKNPVKELIKLSFEGRRKFIILVVSLVLIIAAIITIAVSMLNKDISGSEPSQTMSKIDTIRQEILWVFEDEGANAGINKYQEYIDVAESNTEKAELYSWRASDLYSRYGDNFSTKVLEDAYAAEKLNPTDQTALMIYIYESRWGSADVAAEYLALATERNPDVIDNSDDLGSG